MNRSTSSLAAAILTIAAMPAAAQWLNYPTPGIPRLPNGKPNLSASAPRTLDGKPDLSGIWHSELKEANAGYLFDITKDLRPEEVLPWADTLYKQRVDNLQKDSPVARCLPPGLPLFEIAPATYRIIQTQGLIEILYEEPAVVRQIFMDGRPLPQDPNPTWMGYSVGKWEGDTVIVDTMGFNDKTWLDVNGHPHSEGLRITERFHRVDFGQMELRITIDDPKTFARPFTVITHPKLRADYEMLEFVCNENEKDVKHMVGK